MNLNVDVDSVAITLDNVYASLSLMLPDDKCLKAQEPIVRETIELTRKLLAERDLDGVKLCVTLLWRPLHAKGHLNPWLISIHETFELLLVCSRIVRGQHLGEVYDLAYKITSQKKEGVPFDTLLKTP